MASSSLRIGFLFIVSIALISFLITFSLNNSSASGLSEKDVNLLIGKYIKENPQEIIDSLTQYQIDQQKKQEEETTKNISEKLNEIQNNPLDPIAGNPQGDIVIAEFFDYSCGYCKKILPYISELLKNDDNIKVVFKELPILGPDSYNAAKIALAVNLLSPDKYFDYHAKLMQGRYRGAESMIQLAVSMGLDRKAVEEKMKSEQVQSIIANNKTLSTSIGIRGTPAIIINDQFFPGAIDLNTFRSVIAQIRSNKEKEK